jgi:hypothetical protein
VAALVRALGSCEAARRACRPGSAKAAAATAQRDALAADLRALTQLLSPHGGLESEDEGEESEPAEEAAC